MWARMWARMLSITWSLNLTLLLILQRNHLLKMLTTPEEIRMEYLGIEKTKPEGTHIAANLPHNKPTNR